jgi:DNA polymerase
MSLGRISAQSLIGTKVPITRLRGRFYSYRGIALMPTFHPAYLLRNRRDKWLTWADAEEVLRFLGRSVAP